jgi:multidrug efflux pump
MTLSDLSLRRPVLAAVASILIVVFGIAAILRLPVRELPDVDTAEVTVSVDYIGASPPVIDAEIATVIEGAISSVSGVETISTESELDGFRSVITFDPGRDIDSAANDVRAAVQRVAAELPEQADPPVVEKNDTEGEPVVRLNLTSDRLSPSALTDYAERYIRDRLERLPGVAQVQFYGERLYAMRVRLDPRAMAARSVTVEDVAEALRGNNLRLPAGAVETASRTLQLRTETRLETAEAFGAVVVAEREGGRVLLRDVAEVEVGVESDDTLFRANGETAVGLGVLRQSRSNVLSISEAVRAEVEAIRERLPAGASLTISSDDAAFIRASIEEVLKSLGIAVALVVAVIFAFLAQARATLIPAVTIPVSLLGACAGLLLAGFSINILTLFALILAIGLVVDDAIVVLENIQRRIERGEAPLLAAATGARQVTFAVLATSLTLIAVFVPLSYLQGEVGRLFTEFGFTLAMAVVASTFVALTLTPPLAARLLPADPKPSRFGRAVEMVFGAVADGYRRALRHALRAPAVVLGLSGLVTGAAAALYPALPSELTPAVDRGVLFVSLDAPVGASLEYTDEATRQVEAALEPWREDGAVESVIAISGRYGEPNRAFVVATLAPWGERETTPQEIVSDLRPKLAEITRAGARASTPSGLGVGGGGSPVEAKLGGPSFEDVADWSATLAERARALPELSGVEREYSETQPILRVSVNRDRAREIGVDARAVSQALEAFFASREVTEWIDRDRQYPVLLEARERDRDSPADLSRIYLRAAGGALVPLDGLVEVERSASVRAYNRFNRQPAVEVSAALGDGADLGAAIEALERAAEGLPAGATISWDGQAREYLDTSSGVVTTFALALLVVFLVLAAQFESFVLPVTILLSTPLAAAGALFALFATEVSLNIYSQVGLVLLIGLMAKNGILIVEFANQLRDEGREVREAILEASTVRLRPILMTVASTVLGAVPLVVSSGAGAESRLAIGVTIIGGFLFASVLTLFLTPVLYDRLARATSPSSAAARRLDRLLARDGAS